MNDKHTCVLCKQPFTGWGNNPAPVKQRGLCCNDCNDTKVLPARIKAMLDAEKPKLSNDQHHKAGKAYLEIVDNLYTIQEIAGLTQEWVQETANDITHQFEAKTGVDLSDF